ncbi:MAG TPA: formate dehydrogenase accessory protein FdhE [Bryobacteraceae bacterium]|nr:formate dehydrogenase accessory protein FdhE [Bryobacteraceae bacterium]
MTHSLDDRIARASQLALRSPAAAGLLEFYIELARFQKPVLESLRRDGETDVRSLARYLPALIQLVQRKGTEQLASFGVEHLLEPAAQQNLLVSSWEGRANDLAANPAGRFFARVVLQPYAEYLASRGDVRPDGAGSACPFCNSRPLAGVLRGEGEGAKRSLLCSLCSTEWPFRRVLCPNCGEGNQNKLPIYTAQQFAWMRVDACDTCQTYLKSVDLTKDGHAVPVVDEIATVALNIWAEEHGYSKLEANLLGM